MSFSFEFIWREVITIVTSANKKMSKILQNKLI